VRLLVSVMAAIGLALAGVPAVAAASPAGNTRRSAVIEIGGAASFLRGNEWVFLQSVLGTPQLGYGEADVLAYSYHIESDPLSQLPYSIQETCQPLATSVQHLADLLTARRQQKLFDSVTLVGHSQGGVLAMDVLSGWPDLSEAGSPFIRSVVTVDSPLGGLAWTRAFVWESFGSGGRCQSVRELAARHDQPRIMQDYYIDKVGAAMQRGVHVQVVVNDADLYLTPANQALLGLDVITEVDVEGPSNNHTAALYDPATLAQLGDFIGPQGQ
jgi:pimeloyl-ACP methyl ester carboxylesterase